MKSIKQAVTALATILTTAPASAKEASGTWVDLDNGTIRIGVNKSPRHL